MTPHYFLTENQRRFLIGERATWTDIQRAKELRRDLARRRAGLEALAASPKNNAPLILSETMQIRTLAAELRALENRITPS